MYVLYLVGLSSVVVLYLTIILFKITEYILCSKHFVLITKHYLFLFYNLKVILALTKILDLKRFYSGVHHSMNVHLWLSSIIFHKYKKNVSRNQPIWITSHLILNSYEHFLCFILLCFMGNFYPFRYKVYLTDRLDLRSTLPPSTPHHSYGRGAIWRSFKPHQEGGVDRCRWCEKGMADVELWPSVWSPASNSPFDLLVNIQS